MNFGDGNLLKEETFILGGEPNPDISPTIRARRLGLDYLELRELEQFEASGLDRGDAYGQTIRGIGGGYDR